MDADHWSTIKELNVISCKHKSDKIGKSNLNLQPIYFTIL